MSAPTQLCIKVSDTGCGIPKSFRSVLFEPFRQADTSLTRPRQGTGLGLSIVKHLVQRMSGSIEVDSTEGEGTSFTVGLPVTLQSRSPSPSSTPPPPKASRRVRVVYRDARTQDQYLALWQAYGYTVLPGEHTASADELMQDVDAIWTDADTVARSPALRSLMGPSSSSASSPSVTPHVPTSPASAAADVVLFVVHSDSNDLAPLEPALNEGRNVVLVKRPVIMHAAAAWLDDPAARAGAHIRATKVRFALPVDDEDADEDEADGEDGGEEPKAPPPAAKEKAPAAVATKEKKPLRVAVGARKAKAAEAAREAIPLSPVRGAAEAARPRVLLVEDNLVNQRLGCRLLEKLGYEAVTANDGQQALDVLVRERAGGGEAEGAFVACLMDCQMPGASSAHLRTPMCQIGS